MSALSVIPDLSQAYVARASVPLANVTSTANLTKSVMHALYTMLANLATGGTAQGARAGANIFNVLSSTDGVTYSAADNIGATFSATKWKAAAPTTTHAHVVLGNGEVDLLIDANSATAGQFRVSAAMHANPFTGGATTTGPTAPYEMQAQSGHTPSVSTPITMLNDLTLNGSQYAHIVIGADGSFHFFTTRAGQGGANFYLALLKCNDVQAGDAFPWVLISMAGPPTSRGVPDRGTFLGSGAYIEYTQSDGVRYNGTGGMGPSLLFGGTQWAAQSLDTINGKPQTYEIEVQSLDGPATLRKGTLRDTLQIGGLPANFGGYPSAGANQQRIVLNGLMIPFPVLTPIF